MSFPRARSGTRHVVRMRTPMSGHDFVDLGSSAVAYVESASTKRPPSTALVVLSRRRRPRRVARGCGAAAMTPEALAADAFVFFGTAAEERWARDAFLRYARQRFATGNTWSYAVVARRCDEVSDGVVAFDEVLDNANLGRCRSTGVIIGGKLAQYNLSLPVPNELILDVVAKIRQKIELLHVDASLVVVQARPLVVPNRKPPARRRSEPSASTGRRRWRGRATKPPSDRSRAAF